MSEQIGVSPYPASDPSEPYGLLWGTHRNGLSTTPLLSDG